MKKIIDMEKYEFQIYLKSNRYIIPLVVTFLFAGVMYSVSPMEVVDSFLISSVFLFLLMTWVGLSAVSAENPVTEQVLLTHIRSPRIYYLGKIFFLFCICIPFDLLCILAPLFQNIASGNAYFTRPLLFSDLLHAFLLQGGCAFTGITLGSLLHPRIIKDRKMASILAVFVALITVTGPGISHEFPLLKGIFLFLPPVMIPLEWYGEAEYFSWNQTFCLTAVLFLYGTILSIFKSWLCARNKF